MHPLCGVVRNLSIVELPPGIPPIFIFRGELAAPFHFTRGGRAIRTSSEFPRITGVGVTKEGALWSFVGEAVERYAASTFTEDRTIWSNYESISQRAIDPRLWIGYTPEQYSAKLPLLPFDPKAEIRWVEGISLLDGTSVLVPASCVWLRIKDMVPSEQFIQPVSTGLAAGTSLAQAAVSGLFELLERDAFANYWMLGVAPPQLPISSLADDQLPEVVSQLFEGNSLNITLYDIRVDVDIPCVLAKASLPGPNQGFALGASAAPDYTTAAIKATIEAFHIFLSMQTTKRNNPEPLSLSEIRSFIDHGRYYYEHPAEAEFFFNNPNVSTTTTDAHNSELSTAAHLGHRHLLGNLVQRITERGFDPILVDLTLPDIDVLGLKVVRCLIPGLQPITAGYNLTPHDLRRVMKVSSTLKLASNHSLNFAPHPFA